MDNKNIVLIGMSGAGKSTIGIALSYKMKMPFVDMDNYIERNQGMRITEIFDTYGNDYFRNLESETALYMAENYKKTIISTGGGIILNPENMINLKKNGIVIYINRSVENILKTLNAEKRPLLRDNPEKLYDMYKERHSIYLKYADIVVYNSSDFKSGVENVYNAVMSYKNN
ncbi:MAG: shikimate kinase [Clostridia bacterium]|nr:shikimate kinase [Clostridia bacterium]